MSRSNPSPPAMQADRDKRGMFAPGNAIGELKRFRPGQSGNPSGRPKGVTYPGDWVRGLCDCTEAELRQIADDSAEPMSRRMAAGLLLDTLDEHTETRGRAVLRIMDRCEGKPATTLNLSADRSHRSEAEIMAQIDAILDRQPDLRALLTGEHRQLLGMPQGDDADSATDAPPPPQGERGDAE